MLAKEHINVFPLEEIYTLIHTNTHTNTYIPPACWQELSKDHPSDNSLLPLSNFPAHTSQKVCTTTYLSRSKTEEFHMLFHT